MIPVFGLLMGSTALASTSGCGGYYWQGEQTNSNNNQAIYGYLTDPSASSMPGDSADHYYNDHILLWGEIAELSAPSGGGCGYFGQTPCWVQGGVGMGSVGEGGDSAYNLSENYEAYYENQGTEDTYTVNFYANIPIDQGVAVGFEVYYDGVTGHDGYPQYQAFIENANGVWVEMDAGELYYPADHASARSEIAVPGGTGGSDICPTLTNGSPWQNFGTDASGTPISSTELELETNNNFSVWTGSPNTGHVSPYYFESLDGAAAFRTNGPASGPA